MRMYFICTANVIYLQRECICVLANFKTKNEGAKTWPGRAEYQTIIEKKLYTNIPLGKSDVTYAAFEEGNINKYGCSY